MGHSMILVGRLNEIQDGGRPKTVPVGKFNISVFNVAGQFYAIKESCPHAEVPLSGGSVKDGTVTCPGHSWQFDLKTGQCLFGDEDVCLRTYSVTVKEGQVWVSVD